MPPNQMLGCGAHVRIIALPHVRCACGSACGKVFGTVRAMCVRMARFWVCDVRSQFYTCSFPFSHILLHTFITFDHLGNFLLLLLSLELGCWRHVRAIQSIYQRCATDQHFGRPSSYYICTFLLFWRKSLGNMKKKVLHTLVYEKDTMGVMG